MLKFVLFLVAISCRKCENTFLKGKRASDGQFPWLIQFQTIAPCGGVLLAPDWVLTAAQCVLDKRNSILLYATGLNGTKFGQTVHVKATYIFPRYEAYSSVHDHDHNIALLKLAEPFDMCDTKIALLDIAPVRYDDDYYQSCLIFGWQSYVAPSFKVLAKPIQYSEVILGVWKFCTHMHKGNVNYSNVFCTMIDSDDGLKACGGNPGSPVICKDQYQRMLLIGIASWTNYSLDCGDLPTYLSVSPFRTWMYELLSTRGSELVSTACNVGKTREEINAQSFPRGSFSRNDIVLQKPTREIFPNYGSPPEVPELAGQIKPNSDNTDVRTKISLSHGYYDLPVFDVVNERSDYLKQFQEVGRGKENQGDEVLAVPAEHGKFHYLSKPFTDIEHENYQPEEQNMDLADVSDDFDLLMPFTFHDTNDSNFHECSRQFMLLCLIFLYTFC